MYFPIRRSKRAVGFVLQRAQNTEIVGCVFLIRNTWSYWNIEYTTISTVVLGVLGKEMQRFKWGRKDFYVLVRTGYGRFLANGYCVAIISLVEPFLCC
jgi:hypothetical protein